MPRLRTIPAATIVPCFDADDMAWMLGALHMPWPDAGDVVENMPEAYMHTQAVNGYQLGLAYVLRNPEV